MPSDWFPQVFSHPVLLIHHMLEYTISSTPAFGFPTCRSTPALTLLMGQSLKWQIPIFGGIVYRHVPVLLYGKA